MIVEYEFTALQIAYNLVRVLHLSLPIRKSSDWRVVVVGVELVAMSRLLPGIVVTPALGPSGVILLAVHAIAASALAAIITGARLILVVASLSRV